MEYADKDAYDKLMRAVAKDIQATHFETGARVYFRLKRMFLEQDINILEEWFPVGDTEEHDGNVFLCGAGQVKGKWIIGYLSPDHIFYPL